jgi:hypothetical protein
VAGGGEPTRDQAAVPQAGGDPDGQIDAVFHEIDVPVVEPEVDAHIRVFPAKRRQRTHEV